MKHLKLLVITAILVAVLVGAFAYYVNSGNIGGPLRVKLRIWQVTFDSANPDILLANVSVYDSLEIERAIIQKNSEVYVSSTSDEIVALPDPDPKILPAATNMIVTMDTAGNLTSGARYTLTLVCSEGVRSGIHFLKP